MDNNVFSSICNKISDLVKDLGNGYKLIQLGGLYEGTQVKRVVVEINGQHFLHIDSACVFFFADITVQTKYQMAKYHCYPDNEGKFQLKKEGKTILSPDVFSCEEFMNLVFADIKNKFQQRQNVAELLSKLIGLGGILPEEIGYDIYDQDYYFRDWNKLRGLEYQFFSNYFRNLRDFNKHKKRYVAKYTSLETALMILNSGKIRMMSVTAMNDRMETGHLFGKLTNEDSAYIVDKTKMNFARKRYITSFSDRIDDLTMWRLYGDNGKGVCLLFSEPYVCPLYLPIDYSGKDSAILKRVEQICKTMNDYGFKFTFKSLEHVWQYFLKAKGFKEENELRYLRVDDSKADGYTVASNGVISSYKDLFLTQETDDAEKNFPTYLSGIILGPNMNNVETNKFQLEAIAYENGFFLFNGVRPSTIDYYI